MFIIIGRVLIIHSKKKLDNLKNERDREQKKRAQGILKALISIVSIMIMFGLSWFFGALSIGDGTIVFQWLFVIFNTTQGFMLFLFFCVIGDEARGEWKNLLTCNKYRQKISLTSGPSSTSNSHSRSTYRGRRRRGRLDSESANTAFTSDGRTSNTIRRSVGLPPIEEKKTPIENVKLPSRYSKMSSSFGQDALMSIHEEDTIEEQVDTSLVISNGNTEKSKKPRQLPPHVYIKLKRPIYTVETIKYDDEDGLQEKVDISSRCYNDNPQDTNDDVFNSHTRDQDGLFFSNNFQDASALDSTTLDTTEPATQMSMLSNGANNESLFSGQQLSPNHEQTVDAVDKTDTLTNLDDFAHSSQMVLLRQDTEEETTSF